MNGWLIENMHKQVVSQAKRIKELEDMLSRLVKENDLAMPNENYQWMYSPMRVECLKVLENK